MIEVPKINEDDKKGKTEAFRMLGEFHTKADNLGARTYRKGRVYRMDTAARAELVARPDVIAELLYVYSNQIDRADYARIAIVPSVTKWFSSDGVDGWNLIAGKEIAVPSNLAVFLTESGYAAKAGGSV